MTSTVLATIAVALISLIGTVFTTKSGNDKIQHELDKHNAVQDTKLEISSQKATNKKSCIPAALFLSEKQ